MLHIGVGNTQHAAFACTSYFKDTEVSRNNRRYQEVAMALWPYLDNRGATPANVALFTPVLSHLGNSPVQNYHVTLRVAVDSLNAYNPRGIQYAPWFIAQQAVIALGYPSDDAPFHSDPVGFTMPGVFSGANNNVNAVSSLWWAHPVPVPAHISGETSDDWFTRVFGVRSQHYVTYHPGPNLALAAAAWSGNIGDPDNHSSMSLRDTFVGDRNWVVDLQFEYVDDVAPAPVPPPPVHEGMYGCYLGAAGEYYYYSPTAVLPDRATAVDGLTVSALAPLDDFILLGDEFCFVIPRFDLPPWIYGLYEEQAPEREQVNWTPQPIVVPALPGRAIDHIFVAGSIGIPQEGDDEEGADTGAIKSLWSAAAWTGKKVLGLTGVFYGALADAVDDTGVDTFVASTLGTSLHLVGDIVGIVDYVTPGNLDIDNALRNVGQDLRDGRWDGLVKHTISLGIVAGLTAGTGVAGKALQVTKKVGTISILAGAISAVIAEKGLGVALDQVQDFIDTGNEEIFDILSDDPVEELDGLPAEVIAAEIDPWMQRELNKAHTLGIGYLFSRRERQNVISRLERS